MMKYVLSIDQSTSGTKALLFDSAGDLILGEAICRIARLFSTTAG